jgi:hypothetical protein
MTSESSAVRRPLPTSIDRLTPRAGVRVQLAAAATVWLVGASILLVRGSGYLVGRYWHAWLLGVALAIGVIKSRYLLDRVATQAVARIRARGRACLFGFFSVKSWAFVALMMGGGIVLRSVIVAPGVIGAGILGALYLGIGTALLIADRVFWHAVFVEVRDGNAGV